VVQLLQHADGLSASATRDAYLHLESLLREEATLLIEQPEVCCNDGALTHPTIHPSRVDGNTAGSGGAAGTAGTGAGTASTAPPAVQVPSGPGTAAVHQGGVLWPSLPPAVATAAAAAATAAAARTVGSTAPGGVSASDGSTVSMCTSNQLLAGPLVLPEEVVAEVAATWGGTLVSGTGQVRGLGRYTDASRCLVCHIAAVQAVRV
jgi:hypothetical protein